MREREIVCGMKKCSSSSFSPISKSSSFLPSSPSPVTFAILEFLLFLSLTFNADGDDDEMILMMIASKNDERDERGSKT